MAIDYNGILKNWTTLTKNISALDEKTVTKLLELELGGRSRATFVKRLQQRLNSIRSSSIKQDIKREYRNET